MDAICAHSKHIYNQKLRKLNLKDLVLSVGLASSTSFDTFTVQVSRNKKTVKLNQQPVGSYKELYDVYKVVTVTEDDLLNGSGSSFSAKIIY